MSAHRPSHARTALIHGAVAIRIAMIIVAVAASASCLGPGTTRSVRYYALNPVAADRPANGEHRRIGIMPVRLPGYLDRPALIERRGVEVLPRPFSAWAAPLDQQFSRVLVENLQRTWPASEIAIFPWRRSFAPDQRLDIDVARFEIENGEALLHARWRVLGTNGNGAGPGGESRIRVPVAAEDDQARVTALSAALGRFSAEVASALDR